MGSGLKSNMKVRQNRKILKKAPCKLERPEPNVLTVKSCILRYRTVMMGDKDCSCGADESHLFSREACDDHLSAQFQEGKLPNRTKILLNDSLLRYLCLILSGGRSFLKKKSAADSVPDLDELENGDSSTLLQSNSGGELLFGV